MDSALYENYLNILKQELVPALGCTEPIAIAYAAAKARQILGEFPDTVEMLLSGNIIKNVKGVTVPNSGGLKGIDVAAILGIVGGNADKALEVLSEVTPKDIALTKELIAKNVCSCSLVQNVDNLYITAKVIKGGHYASVTIEHQHTNVTHIEKNGEVILDNPYRSDNITTVDKSKLAVKDILDFADQVKIEDVQPILVVTKADLGAADTLVQAYKTSGIPLVQLNYETGEGLDEIKVQIKDHLCAFCGNSGVGKSTLLNALAPELQRETGSISQKLGRGRHTTREVEIFEICGGRLADTPGFASLEAQKLCRIPKEDIQHTFPEFEPYFGQCRFTGCSHRAETDCAVRQAVEEGKISKTRYASYLAMYEEASARKEWEK